MIDAKRSRNTEEEQAAANWETIHSIHLHDMTPEEAVRAASKVESRCHYHRGVWWEEVKPFFYTPAAPALAIEKGSSAPNPLLALGGYRHQLPAEEGANGWVVANEIPDLRAYRLEDLRSMVRHNIRRGLRRLRIAKVTSLDDLLRDGYEIYKGWLEGHSGVLTKRSSPEMYSRWISRVHAHPYQLVLGAYDDRRLVSFIIGESIMGTANIAMCFTHPDYYRLTPNTPLVFAFITICQQNPAICRSRHGLRGFGEELTQFKENLGYRQIAYPAYISIRGPIRPLARWFFPSQYRRLMGEYDEQPNKLVEQAAPEAIDVAVQAADNGDFSSMRT